MASVIVLFIFLISSLNDLKRGGWLATQSTPPGSAPEMGTISVKFQQIISEESIWMTSLTLKAFMVRHDKKGARKVINVGPRLQISRTLGF